MTIFQIFTLRDSAKFSSDADFKALVALNTHNIHQNVTIITPNTHNLHERWLKWFSGALMVHKEVKMTIFMKKKRFFRDFGNDFKAMGALCIRNMHYNVTSISPNSHNLHEGWFKMVFRPLMVHQGVKMTILKALWSLVHTKRGPIQKLKEIKDVCHQHRKFP